MASGRTFTKFSRLVMTDKVAQCAERFAHCGRSLGRVMRVGGDKVNPTLKQQLFRPALGASTESAQNSAGGHLYPGSRLDQPIHEIVVSPGHSLRVGQYRDIASRKQVEKKPVDIRRKDMMRGLNEDVPAVVDAKHKA